MIQGEIEVQVTRRKAGIQLILFMAASARLTAQIRERQKRLSQ